MYPRGSKVIPHVCVSLTTTTASPTEQVREIMACREQEQSELKLHFSWSMTAPAGVREQREQKVSCTTWNPCMGLWFRMNLQPVPPNQSVCLSLILASTIEHVV